MIPGMHIALKIALLLLCLFALVAALQTGAALRFAKEDQQPQASELLVGCPGSTQRFTTGIATVQAGQATHFMVIGQTAKSLERLLQLSGGAAGVTTLPGGTSRSTFEDVYQTIQTIRENGFSSVVVVSSSYHLPRVLLLFHTSLRLAGLDVRVQALPVNERQSRKQRAQQHYSEAVKLWGSLLEISGYYCIGRLVLDIPQIRNAQLAIKDNFLW